MTDAINPSHHKRLPAEAIEIIESAIDGAPSNQDAYLHGQVLACVLQCWDKNGIEDLKEAKWYLDRLVDSLDEWEKQKAADLQSLKDYPFGKLKTPINSDTIPEGYRRLNDSSVEPRQLGDLRWSVSKKRYIEISVDEIGYANRDNWAACRKVEPVVKQSLTPEPPDGWRFLERGEVIRKGDIPFENGQKQTLGPLMIGQTYQKHWKPIIRRNRFEVGEKVVAKDHNEIWDVDSIVNGVYQLRSGNVFLGSFPEHLAPYIEEAILEIAVEVTQEVKLPEGWRFLERGEVIRKGDKPIDRLNMLSNWIGKPCASDKFIIRRNRFNVGEKVVRASNGVIYEIVAERPDGTYKLKDAIGHKNCLFAIDLAPYEDAK